MKFGDLSISLDYGDLGILHSFASIIRERREGRDETFNTPGNSFRRRRFDKENLKKHAKSIVIALGIIVVIISLGKMLFKVGNSKGSTTPEIKPALATMAINKEFSFPLTASGGDKVSDVKFMIENAELRDEIIVNGQRATSIKGRDFLILTIKISNEYKSAIQINSRDYVRLSVNGNEGEWLAPDIHNDPVEVQAISTKYTRLGFAINETDKNLLLRIGEINGEKETIPLEFNR